MAEVIKVDVNNFDNEVVNSDVPVFVDFYADWCGPCKMMAPVVEEIAEEYDGKIKVVKINIDDNQTLAVKYDVQVIPTMVVFSGGDAKDKVVGVNDKDALTDIIDKLL